jgi:hypothetical protein
MGFALFLLYLTLTFVRPAELFPHLEGLPIMSLASLVAVGGALLAVLLGRGPSFRALQPYLVAGFILWAMFSVVAATRWFGGALDTFSVFFRGSGLVYFLVVANIDSARRMRLTASLLSVLALFVVGEGVLAAHFGVGEELFTLRQRDGPADEGGDEPSGLAGDPDRPPGIVRIRSLGFLNDPNDLAQALVAVLPLLVALRHPGRRFRNLILVWLPAAALVYGVYLTRSRGGILALVAVVFFGLRHRVGRTLSVSLSVVVLAGLLVLGFAQGRAMSLDESAMGRADAWSEGLQMLKASPIWGIGFGFFTEHHNLVAHNSFVHCFAELGLVGYFLWLNLLALTLGQLVAMGRTEPDPEDEEGIALVGWSHAVLVSLVGFLTGALFLSRTYGVMLFLLLGLATAVTDVARRLGWSLGGVGVAGWIARVLALEVGSITAVWLFMRVLH